MNRLNLIDTNKLIAENEKKRGRVLSEAVRRRVVELSDQFDGLVEILSRTLADRPELSGRELLAQVEVKKLLKSHWDEACEASKLELLISGRGLFKEMFAHEQNWEKLLSPNSSLTRQEIELMGLLVERNGEVVGREDLAENLWGKGWLDHYSDWAIDRAICDLRAKMSSYCIIETVRNRGYRFATSFTLMPNKIKQKSQVVVPVSGTTPTEDYLQFMNDPKNARQFYANLFQALNNERLELHLKRIVGGKVPKAILAINSFTAENIDVLTQHISKKRTDDIYFTNFDEAALDMHRKRAEFLNLNNVHALFDDIRNSRLKDESFDLIINDFRLNFNQDNMQNVASVSEMHRLAKKNAICLVSVVVDCRYDSARFGKDQEKAPLNKQAPWTFVGKEGLERKCFTVPYYKNLFKEAGWSVVAEFDIEAGKAWKNVEQADPKKAISFRRFLLKKD